MNDMRGKTLIQDTLNRDEDELISKLLLSLIYYVSLKYLSLSEI